MNQQHRKTSVEEAECTRMNFKTKAEVEIMQAVLKEQHRKSAYEWHPACNAYHIQAEPPKGQK